MDDTQTAARRFELEPFDFYPNRRSALGGLGGDDGHTDPTYAFHTRYQAVAPGRITFSVRLNELSASSGTLVLRILALPDGHAAEPTAAAAAQVALRTIAERGREVSIGTAAEEGTSYALLGLVVDDTDAMLTGIAIDLDSLEHGDTDVSGMAEGTTRFGDAATLVPIPMLLTSDTPTLALPVSQVRSAEQLREPHFDRWSRAIGGGADEEAWSRVYILRVLESYGVLARGARGLSIGDHDAGMARAVAAAGCALTVHDLDPAAGDGATPFPEELRGFDFLWTRHLLDRLPSTGEGQHLIERALACLNVGGIAVHVFRFVAGTDGADAPGALVYTRAGMERLAFHLIAGNHELAQFNYHLTTGVPPQATSFGLILRKGSY